MITVYQNDNSNNVFDCVSLHMYICIATGLHMLMRK